MKIVNAGYEILTPINKTEILKALEIAGRVCYKSENKITDTSASDFVRMLIKRGHEAIIEHCSISVKFICDRGVSHEIVRHRIASYGQESTRYVSGVEKRPLKEFDCDVTEDIVAAYSQGFSMREISEKSNYTEWEIRKLLLSNDVKIRGLNNKGKRDNNFFKIIDSPEKAYLLGLIQTDGNVRRSERNAAITITQHRDYSWYIKIMLRLFTQKMCVTSDENCEQIQIGSKDIVDDLINLGVAPNKTKDQSDEDIVKLWDTIPKKYIPSFIRGLIDRDGWVSYFTQKRGINESVRIGFCSMSEKLIDLVNNWLFENVNYTCRKWFDDVWRIQVTDYNKSIELGELLYKDFKYPFGHPKKASTWLKRLSTSEYPIAEIGDSKYNIIVPCYLYKWKPESIFVWAKSMYESEFAYEKLRLLGASPQEARSVLPNSLKTEIVVTMNMREWRHFFKLRTANAAHPQMQEITIPLLFELKKRLPELFEDIEVV